MLLLSLFTMCTFLERMVLLITKNDIQMRGRLVSPVICRKSDMEDFFYDVEKINRKRNKYDGRRRYYYDQNEVERR